MIKLDKAITTLNSTLGTFLRLPLKEKKPILFIAFHGNEQKKRCRRILKAAGYDIFVNGFQIESNASRSEDEIYAVRDCAT